MSITIETDLKDFLTSLEQKIDKRFDAVQNDIAALDQKFDKRCDKIDQRLDTVQNDITNLKIGQTKLEGDIKALDNKGSIIQPIITGITVAFVGGGLLALYKYLPN
jgi:translation initiation factor 6 (eIF-6)